MPVVTVRNLPEATHRALKLRAAQHGRSTEAEIRDILEQQVLPKARVRIGSELAAFGKRPAFALEPAMQTFIANEAKTRFGEFLDRAQRSPVGVLKHDRLVGVLVSAQDYEAMRQFYADRLVRTMDETAKAAALAGLTPEILAELLADES